MAFQADRDEAINPEKVRPRPKPGSHKHLCAKVFLALGLIDVLSFIALISVGAVTELTPYVGMAPVRFGLWVVLPILFIKGKFDEKEP